ncbi:GAF domain-containing protein [Streptomonospora sp. S1-112]|uniref:GAF domain-containing protein n=1 Tax=Streptomonospora mangrovi TaxID=2883123 RepID=A0A9X3NNC5_9ACTN|nr:GAF domain-containing protein [Streptomonospora mangrovi]MDA0566929.1 GAF domain-containing protein [Streptomonospora mangrovi]
MVHPHLDAAVPAGTDPREYARLLRRVHEAVLAGRTPPARPRPVIADSWARMRVRRVDPETGRRLPMLAREDIQRHRRESPLVELLPMLRQSLTAVADDAAHVMVITDEKSRVLWRDGPARVRRLADSIGLVEGAAWNEDFAGTNAIGTALVVGQPLQVYSAEHYVRGLHQVTCACAPVHDPRNGRPIGAVDVTGPAETVHPATLALVNAVAQHAESMLRGWHHAHLERLRVVAAPLLAGMRGRALVVDNDGWTAAAAHMEPVRRVLLPRSLEAGVAWLPGVGECHVEPLPGGWLVRPDDGESAPASHLLLDLSDGTAPQVTVSGASGTWSHRLSLRHSELLFLLARSPNGRSAAQLAADLFGDADRLVTVRAEMSRLRRHLGGVVESRPYRLHEGLRVSVRTPPTPAELLPGSTAPGIRRVRRAADWGQEPVGDGAQRLPR